MGRYTVEITVDSGAHVFLSVDVSGPAPLITQITRPAGTVPGIGGQPLIDLAMLARALGPADRNSTSAEGELRVVPPWPKRRRPRPADRGGHRGPASPR